MIRVAVQYAGNGELERTGRPLLPAPRIRELARASLAAARLEGEGQLTVRMVQEEESRELNRTWRGSDRPTNVLAFEADRKLGEIGDVVICLPLACSEAGDRGTAPGARLAHLVVHGCLHLAGLDHLQPRQARAMEALESRVLTEAGWPDPWAEE